MPLHPHFTGITGIQGSQKHSGNRTLGSALELWARHSFCEFLKGDYISSSSALGQSMNQEEGHFIAYVHVWCV